MVRSMLPETQSMESRIASKSSLRRGIYVPVFRNTVWDFFEVFDFALVRGNPETALTSPMSIVLTEETAARFFGNADPVGQTILGLNDFEYSITGVIEKAPENSHLKYNVLISWSSTVPGTGPLNFSWLNRWITQVTLTYLLLAPGADPVTLAQKLPDFLA